MENDKDNASRPIVTFFQPQSNHDHVFFSSFIVNEIALQKFLPKSHVSNVIIRDNTSVQRVQEIKLRHLESSKRKIGNYCENLKKTFLHNQKTKINRWKHQYSRYQRMLEKIDQRAMQQEGPAYNMGLMIALAQRSSIIPQKSILKIK